MHLGYSLDTLPLHIIKHITKYLVAKPAVIGNLHSDIDHASSLWPLLRLCRTWRSVALSLKYAACLIDVNGSVHFSRLLNSVPVHMSRAEACMHTRHIRKVSLHVDCNGLTSDPVDLQPTNASATSLCFPAARLLSVNISVADSSQSQLPLLTENLERLTRFVSNAMPLVSVCELNLIDYNTDDIPVKTGQIDVLVKHILSQGQSRQLSLECPNDIPAIETILHAPCITNLQCTWGSNHAQISRIIHFNAGALMKLDLECHTSANFEHLIFDKCGNNISYTNLACLVLGMEGAAGYQMPAVDDIAPFPRLTSLKIDGLYPFGDGMPFRGNGSTLETVEMHINSETMQILDNCGVFSSQRLKCMRSLTLHRLERSGGALLPKYAYFTVLSRILKYVKVLVTTDSLVASNVADFLEKSNGQYNLLRLDVSSVPLSLEGCTKMLRVLPQLQAFVCTVANFRNDLRYGNIESMAHELKLQYGSVGRHLKRIDITPPPSTSITQRIGIILFFAYLSPHLEVVNLCIPLEEARTVVGGLAVRSLYSKFKREINPPLQVSICPNAAGAFIRVRNSASA